MKHINAQTPRARKASAGATIRSPKRLLNPAGAGAGVSRNASSPGHASPGPGSPGHASPGPGSPGHASPGPGSPGLRPGLGESALQAEKPWGPRLLERRGLRGLFRAEGPVLSAQAEGLGNRGLGGFSGVAFTQLRDGQP